MFSITCFREHSNLRYTGKPCFDAKKTSFSYPNRATYMAIDQNKINNFFNF